MGGDYTRFSFEAQKAYNALLRQQGRVGLDADHNEAAEIADRRWRSGTYDLLGRCRAAATTPDAFHLAVTGPGALDLGAGRAYVDGIQVECFGTGAPAWDPVLAELRRPDATSYDDQPFLSAVEPHLPDPPPLGAPADGDQHLVYLDVWYREIDALVDPELREVALGGPDTAARLQTVWQVRALELGAGGLECDDEVAAWTALVEPSAGRLTTATEAPEPQDNPCILSPEGGYRGRENRLYRVEVHTAGGDGSAGLKWSRDNASVKAAVTAMDTVQFDVDLGPGVNVQPATRLTLASLGRDAVLRFRRGDWLEVLDERIDLDPARSGELARVLDVDEADRTLTLDRDLVALGLFDPADANRRTRAVRWDQGDAADPVTGLLAVPGAPAAFQVDLEDGIHVLLDLDPAGGRFLVGDHWVFAARVATSSVDELVAAPPRGIHHHYCKLAIVTWPDGVESCIDPEPEPAEEGCCTEVVHPGESIQDAIDALPPAGGCVCLKAGDHPVDEPVVIDRPDVHLHGESAGARVVRTNGVGVLWIGPQADATVVESVDLVVELDPGTQVAEQEVVRIAGSQRVTLRACRFLVERFLAFGAPLVSTTAVEVTRGVDVTIEDCAADGVWAGVVAVAGERLVVVGCDFRAERLRVLTDIPLGEYGVVTTAADRNLVRDNRFDGFRRAVVIGPPAVGSLVAANRVRRSAVPFGLGQAKVFGIELQAAGSIARDNVIALPTSNLGGIRLVAAATCAEKNCIEVTGPLGSELSIGILVEDWFALYQDSPWASSPNLGSSLDAAFNLFPGDLAVGAVDRGPTNGVVVAGNWLLGTMDAVVVQGTRDTVVRDNQLDARRGEQGTGVTLADPFAARVLGNRVQGFLVGVLTTGGLLDEISDNVVSDGSVGIGGTAEQGLRIARNAVAGAAMVGCGLFEPLITAELLDNRVIGCGWAGELGVGAGIVAMLGLAEVSVDRCQVIDTGQPPPGEDRAVPAAWGILLAAVLSCRVEGCLVSHTNLGDLDPVLEDRALVAIGWLAPSLGDNEVIAFGSALVLGNKLIGPGRSALVQVAPLPFHDQLDLRFAKVAFSNNHCLHLSSEPSDALATVWLGGNWVNAMGNHVEAGPEFFSFLLTHGRNLLLGNLTSGDVLGAIDQPPTPGNFNSFSL
ncbi:MAG TPA: DUF6519 domain-containing protein [Thermoanaerobaculia bacterium]|nr:DUF6519 domain-containing protein [Thermoanaerobaculia bacterium]